MEDRLSDGHMKIQLSHGVSLIGTSGSVGGVGRSPGTMRPADVLGEGFILRRRYVWRERHLANRAALHALVVDQAGRELACCPADSLLHSLLLRLVALIWHEPLGDKVAWRSHPSAVWPASLFHAPSVRRRRCHSRGRLWPNLREMLKAPPIAGNRREAMRSWSRSESPRDPG